MGCGNTKVKEQDNQNSKKQTDHNGNEADAVHDQQAYRVIFVVGGPGTGKGTQCSKLAEEFGFVHLSTGDILRQESANKGNPRSEEIEKILKEGGLVSSELLVDLIKTNLSSRSKNTRVLLDGYPRNQENVDVWNRVMKDYAEVPFLLFFTCSEEEMVSRLLKRGETSGRSDDNEESIKKRLETFRQQTEPIIEEFRTRNLLREVNSEREKETVYEEVKKIIIESHLDK